MVDMDLKTFWYNIDINYIENHMQERTGCSNEKAKELAKEYLKSNEFEKYKNECLGLKF